MDANNYLHPTEPTTASSRKFFLLLDIPNMTSRVKHYASAYVAGIIKACNWHVDYIDLNDKAFQKAPESVRKRWDTDYHDLSYLSELSPSAEEAFQQSLSNTDLDKYSIIGVSVYSSCRAFTTPLLQTLRLLNYKGMILFGGPDCFPQNYGKQYFDSSRQYHPSAILYGEAENSLPEFLKAFFHGGDGISGVPGFYYKTGSGIVEDSGPPTMIKLKDFDYIADYSIFNGDYKELLCTFTSRGCINKCTFCSEWSSYAPLRYRNLKTVIEEIKAQKRISKNCKSLWIMDSNFTTSGKFIEKFTQSLIDETENIVWHTYGCFRFEFDDNLTSLLVKSGLSGLFIGMESASQVIIDYMWKEFDINNAQKQLMRLTKAGVAVQLPILNGFPGEATSDFIVTNAFILRYNGLPNVSFPYSNTCGLFGGSIIQKHPDSFGIDGTYAAQNISKTIDGLNIFGHRWATIDGTNNFGVRMLRGAINSSLIGNLHADDFDPITFFEDIDINDPFNAVELAKIIYLLGVATNSLQAAVEIIQHVSKLAPRMQSVSCERARLVFLSGVIPGITLTDWILANKNCEMLKLILKHVYRCYFEFEHVLAAQQYPDLHALKSQLYPSPHNFRTISDASLMIRSIYLSDYDHGRFVILEGFVYDVKNGVPACGLYAKTSSHVVEFLYGVKNLSYDESDNLYYTGFLGKVKRSYFEKEFEIYISFADGSYAREVITDTIIADFSKDNNGSAVVESIPGGIE